MTKLPSALRIHTESASPTDEARSLDLHLLERACTALEELTGFRVSCSTSQSNRKHVLWQTHVFDAIDSHPALHLSIEPRGRARTDAAASLQSAIALAETTCRLLTELNDTRKALWLREAELATHIPVVSHGDDGQQIATCLQAVLRGGVLSLGCQAAALYLLDDGTSELKLRAHWGLPQLRFVEPARPLRHAVADLEALTGHAVVIEDTHLLPHWNVPESYPAAVCVPVSSPTVLLGTLWIFSDRVRDFDTNETNLIEIIAGRLAAELERSILLAELKQAKEEQRQLESISTWRQDRQRLVPPLLDRWEVYGSESDESPSDANFAHWNMGTAESLTVVAGGVAVPSLSGFLSSIALRSAVQVQLQTSPEISPAAVLSAINRFAWSTSPGDQRGSVFVGQIDTVNGHLVVSTAGTADAYLLRPHGWEPLSTGGLTAGLHPEVEFSEFRTSIAPGDVLLAVGHQQTDEAHASVAWLAEALLRHMHLSAKELTRVARKLLAEGPEATRASAFLVVKRREE